MGDFDCGKKSNSDRKLFKEAISEALCVLLLELSVFYTCGISIEAEN